MSIASRTFAGAARGSLRATLELVLPTTCGGCDAPGATWCAVCARDAGRATYPGGPRQVWPSPRPAGYPHTWSTTPYDGAARAALVAFKDGERRDLGCVLVPMLSDAVAAALAGDPRLAAVLASGNGPVFVVPVPSAPAAVRRRGDAPLELLTRGAVVLTARRDVELIVAPALRLARRVADQSGLNYGQRASNLEHAMAVRPRWRASVRGVTCLLTDDVLTTGATLVEAARALRAGGAAHVAAATVAATRRYAIPAAGTSSDVLGGVRGAVAGAASAVAGARCGALDRSP